MNKYLSKGLICLAILVIITSSCKKRGQVPIVTTTNVSSITIDSALSGGNVTSDRGSSVTARGVCWSVKPDPTIADSKSIDGAGASNYKSVLSGLNGNTSYFVRAYATNGNGTGYGSALSFNTPLTAILTTSPVINISASKAYCGGNITSDGGEVLLDRGLVWDISPNPTYPNSPNKSKGSPTLGSFSLELAPLLINTKYYVRAYAKTKVGITYGNTISFITANSFVIGDYNQDGTIVYLLKPGDIGYNPNVQHGLISGEQNGLAWDNGTHELTSAIGRSFGTGYSNTNLITTKHGLTKLYAAQFCSNKVTNSSNEWFLGSIDEVEMTRQTFILLYGGSILLNGYFWTSTEYSLDSAYALNLNDGSLKIENKNIYHTFSAMRQF